MVMTRAGFGVLWFSLAVAFGACSGKTTDSSDDEPGPGEAGSGGSTPEPGGSGTGGRNGSTSTGGTSSNGDAGSADPPVGTGGNAATGGTVAGGTAAGGTAAGGTAAGGDLGEGGDIYYVGGHDSGVAGSAPASGGRADGSGGRPATGGASGALFGCGPTSCVEGRSYCFNFTSGVPGGQGRAECKRLPEDCTDCECLCPPTSPDGQCSGLSGDDSASCLCGGEPGKIVISCFGS